MMQSSGMLFVLFKDRNNLFGTHPTPRSYTIKPNMNLMTSSVIVDHTQLKPILQILLCYHGYIHVDSYHSKLSSSMCTLRNIHGKVDSGQVLSKQPEVNNTGNNSVKDFRYVLPM